MVSERQRLDELKALLIQGATESLDLELKEWIDPNTPFGKSKIAKACLALRNNDGGRLVIGFNDEGIQCKTNSPSNTRACYSSDVIQEIVGKYASEPFGITMDYLEIEGVEHPVVCVPGGIKNPAICKSDLHNDEGNALLRDNSLYVRSVKSNHRVSSSEIRRGDWDRLLTICFENREADVARFVRRHLVDIFDPQLLQATATNGQSASILNLLDIGFARYRELCNERQTKLPKKLGYREFAVEVNGVENVQVPSFSLLQKIANNAPRISGWSPWVILLGSRTAEDRPQINQGTFESFIDYLGGEFMGPHLDFWSINPSGKFYHIRAMEDDFIFTRQGYEKIVPGEHLDFLLQISRVAEGIAVAISISQTLGFDPETTQLKFAARWQGLRGRGLCSWADRNRHFGSWGNAVQNEFVHAVRIPLNVAKGDIHEYVRPIIDNLFAIFGGTEVEGRVIQGIVNEALDRR
ncbi:MAG: putative DNA binding domain-containing protein [Pirellulaceae bacterium]|nr:putative DNA binding domain-containing protein [Pirellulaceae bacterium]